MSGPDVTMDPRKTRVGGLTCAEAEELAVLCVLDVLTPDEAAPVHAHLAGCHQPHTDIGRAAEAAGALALSTDPVQPPAELRGRLMAAVAGMPQVPDRLAPVDAVAPPTVVPFERRPSRMVWVGLAAAAVIALLLGGWNLSLQRQVSEADQQLALVRQAVAAAADPTSRVATLSGTDAAPAVSGLAVVPASGTGYLMVQGLPVLPDDQVYQAWYLADGVPTSAGVMDLSDSGMTVMTGLAPMPGTDTIALTIEPTGGMPQPTGAVVAAGTLPA